MHAPHPTPDAGAGETYTPCSRVSQGLMPQARLLPAAKAGPAPAPPPGRIALMRTRPQGRTPADQTRSTFIVMRNSALLLVFLSRPMMSSIASTGFIVWSALRSSQTRSISSGW